MGQSIASSSLLHLKIIPTIQVYICMYVCIYEYVQVIDTIYISMGKVDRLRNRVKPFAALPWGLGIVLANT